MPVLVVSRGLTYSYQHYPPTRPGTDYVLFLHGWPSAANDWHNQIHHFRKLGWGVIAPDLPGCGRTSRPSEAGQYVLRDIVEDVIEILDQENISKVHAVGHDWGSILLSRLAIFHPERTSKLCFIAVGHRPPGGPFDLDAVNDMTRQKVGAALFGYQYFLIRNERAHDILNEHKDSFMSLMFAKDPSAWKDHFAPRDALQKFVEADRRSELAPYFTEVDYQNFRENTSEELGGIPSLGWYKANDLNLNYEAEKDLSNEQKILQQPTLLITCSKDEVAIPILQTMSTKQFTCNLKIQELNTSHWAFLEAPDAVNEALEHFFNSN